MVVVTETEHASGRDHVALVHAQTERGTKRDAQQPRAEYQQPHRHGWAWPSHPPCIHAVWMTGSSPAMTRAEISLPRRVGSARPGLRRKAASRRRFAGTP